jgi:hypothetical protein
MLDENGDLVRTVLSLLHGNARNAVKFFATFRKFLQIFRKILQSNVALFENANTQKDCQVQDFLQHPVRSRST